MFFGLIFIEPLMRLLGSTDTILPYAINYCSFILLAAPAMTGSCVKKMKRIKKAEVIDNIIGMSYNTKQEQKRSDVSQDAFGLVLKSAASQHPHKLLVLTF